MKPKIYGFCDAGCKWESVHKADFDRIASVIKQSPDENGYYHLNPLNAYKVHTTKADGAYQAFFTLQGGNVDYWFDCTEYDEYRDYIIFEILSLSLNDTATELTIVYEINGNRYIDIYTDNDAVFSLDGVELQISKATEVYSFSNNAQIEACVQIRGIDTYFGEPQNLKANEYGVSWTDDFMLYDEHDKEFHGGRIDKHVPIVAGEGVELEYDAGANIIKINASGGTTLNKYTFTISGSTVDQTAANRARVYRIFEQAKGRVMAHAVTSTDTAITGAISSNGYLYLSATSIYYYSSKDEYTTVIASEFIDSSGSRYSKYRTRFEPDGSITHDAGGVFGNRITITYWNDVEIV